MKSEIKEINEAYTPCDYFYTASIPGDIHVDIERLPYKLDAVLTDFCNLDVPAADEKPSVMDRIRAAAKEPKESHKDNHSRNKSGPEL